MQDQPNMERQAQVNLDTISEDLSIVWVEARNAAKGLYGGLSTNQRNAAGQYPTFLENFFALWISTKFQLDKDSMTYLHEESEDVDKNPSPERIEEFVEENGWPESLTVEEIEQYFSNPYIFAKKQDQDGNLVLATDSDGNPQMDPAKTSQRGLDIFNEYLEWMREDGLLDIAQYSKKQREYNANQ